MTESNPDAPQRRRKRQRSRRQVIATLLAATVIAAFVACGTKQTLNALQIQPATEAGPTATGGGACSPTGATRSCHENLGKVGNVQQCFVGTQTCIGGQWSACGGSGVVQSSPTSAAAASLGVSATGFKTESLPTAPLTCVAPPACVGAATCTGAVCGQQDNGCGTAINCGPLAGDCPAGQLCLGGECSPTTCTAETAAMECPTGCGKHSDGCLGNVTCPVTCPNPPAAAGNTAAALNCGGGGTPNVCPAKCSPLTAATGACPAGLTCRGFVSDGCGGFVDCTTPPACAAMHKCEFDSTNTTSTCVPTASCVVTTCALQTKTCGYIDNGCGGALFCGKCPAGEQCENGTCQDVCTPMSAAAECGTAVCGEVSDGCGGTVTCGPLLGACPVGQLCDQGACVATSCTVLTGAAQTLACTLANAGLGAVCGVLSDTCLGSFTCGPGCATGQACISGQCLASCTPTTCAAAGVQCGFMDDGCGNPLNCGPCPGLQVCGAGGTPGQCASGACTPVSNLTACGSSTCGVVSNGCDNQYNCPAGGGPGCTTGVCIGGIGLPPPPSASNSCAPGGTVIPGTTGTLTCPAGSSCVLDCSANMACQGTITLQGGGNWTVNCTGNHACSGTIAYSGGPTLILNCGGNHSCGGSISSSATNNTEITCSDVQACGGSISCTSPTCDISCTAVQTCGGAISETVGSGSGCVSCTGNMACGGATSCAGTMCNTSAPSCNCAGGSTSDAGGNTSGGILCANDPCDPYCMENDQIDAGLDGGAGLGPIGVVFDAGQLPPSELNSLNHECPDGSCGAGSDAGPDAAPSGTTISGTIYDPGVNVPLPNVTVFQPSGAVTTPTTGASCDTCTLSPALASTVTDVNGNFTLPVTGTSDIPIVIQVGKWQRQITVTGPLTAGVNNPQTSAPAACVVGSSAAAISACLWRLPQVSAEGNIPLIALITGSQEPIECSIAKFMGGTSEMGSVAAGKRIQLYADDGSNTNPATDPSTTLWASTASLEAYDAVVAGCTLGNMTTVGGGTQADFESFVSAGGKLFIDHNDSHALLDPSSMTGLATTAPFDTTSTWGTYGPPLGSAALGKVLVNDPAHNLFKQWLMNVGAYAGGTLNTPVPGTQATTPTASSFEWLRGANGNDWTTNPAGNYDLSFSFDVSSAGAVVPPGGTGTVCGRVVFNDMHVDPSRGNAGMTFPGECNLGAAESANENAFEYLFFALTSCSIFPVATPAPSGCENYQVASTPQAYYACQMDTYCDPAAGGGSGDCIPFNQGETWAAPAPTPREISAAAAPTIDLTVEQGCSNPAGSYYQFVPICNRGTGPVAAGQTIALEMLDFGTAGPPLDPPGPCPTMGELSAGVPCSLTVPPAGLPAGQCLLLNVATDCAPSETMALGYDQLMFVNSDGAVVEGNLTPTSTISTLASQPVQPGCANNWGILSDGTNAPACSSSVAYTMQNGTYQYTSSTCPMGTHGQWGLLTYNTTIPTTPATDASPVETPEVIFEVATQPIDVDGAVGPLTAYATVADVMGVNGGVNLGDPPVCQSTGPATTTPASACLNGADPTPPCCPKSITSALEEPTPEGLGPLAGQVASTNTNLSLKIVVNPSANGKLTAVVNNWQISFDCVPSE